MPKGVYNHKINQGFQKGNKIGLSNKGIKRTDEFKEKIRQRQLGTKQSIKTIEKRSESLKVAYKEGRRKPTTYWLGKHCSEITKKKLSDKLSGRKIIWAEKISNTLKGMYIGEKSPNWKGGPDNPNLTYYKNKKIEGWEPLKGEKHPRWIIDRTKLQKYSDDNLDRRSSSYAYWRKSVWLRDNFKCKINNCDCNGRIIVHHILSWRDYPELRFNINNGITLCQAHHPMKRAEEKRLIPNFQELVSVSNGNI